MLVSVEELVVVRGETPVLQGISLELAAGRSVGIAGPNGSGKTTLLRVLATLLRPTSGTVRVLGADTTRKEARLVRPSIGLVGHSPALSPNLTLEENLRYVATLGGIDPTRVPAALGMVGLGRAATRLAGKASQGMGRRADLARIILTRPTLLLLDEPFAGLDSHATAIIAAIIDRTTAAGGAAVVVSHEPQRTASVVTETLVLDNGRITR